MLKCSICFENINNNNVKYLPCFHSFHSSCINKWIDKKKNPKCPLCRSTVKNDQSSDSPEYSYFGQISDYYSRTTNGHVVFDPSQIE
jgi:hypothetical protein